MNFCKEQSALSILKISELLNQTYGFNISLIIEKYNELKELMLCHDKVKEPVPINKKELESNILNLDKYYCVGLDLPVWIFQEHYKYKIMVVASEPLRNEVTFEGVYKKNNIISDYYSHILVGTPFAYHYNSSNIENDKTLYWQILDYLSFNSLVYITDIRKIWFAGFEYHMDFIEASYHDLLLSKEIELLKPDFIITFGNNAYDIVKKITIIDTTKTIHLIHPGKRTIPQRKIFFGKHGIDVDNYKESENKYFLPYKELLDNEIGLT